MTPLGRLRGVAVPYAALSVDLNDAGKSLFHRVAHGAIKVPVGSVPVNFGHGASASMDLGQAKVWAGVRGIYCEFPIPNTPTGQSVFCGVRDGQLGLSPRLEDQQINLVDGADGTIGTITAAHLSHIAVTPTPSFQSCHAWLASAPHDQMAPAVRSASRDWHLARIVQNGRAGRPKPEPITHIGGIPIDEFFAGARTGFSGGSVGQCHQ